jgi:hypothetical protein
MELLPIHQILTGPKVQFATPVRTRLLAKPHLFANGMTSKEILQRCSSPIHSAIQLQLITRLLLLNGRSVLDKPMKLAQLPLDNALMTLESNSNQSTKSSALHTWYQRTLLRSLNVLVKMLHHACQMVTT